ncbi:MAG: radical SAM protein [Desulfobulbaceae bacterium]|nr:MAG: radical SAM protein [Desulfobulbaceae bacterium]
MRYMLGCNMTANIYKFPLSIKKSEVFHLPVAPQVTSRTRFESCLPKKLPFVMPEEAIRLLDERMKQSENEIKLISINGPGDPLAVPDTTLKTIELVKKKYPDIMVGIKTLGIGSDRFASALFSAGLGLVEMVVNGVAEEILEKLYAWIRPGQKTLKIGEAVKLLINEQKDGVAALKYHDIRVVIQSVLYPGYNIDHVEKISRKMMELGADGISLIPYHAVEGAEVSLASPNEGDIAGAMSAAKKHLTVVDSLLNVDPVKDTSNEVILSSLVAGPSRERPNVAVVSSNGMEIDMHLGKAEKILIYGPREDGLPCLIDVREAPPPGGGVNRWEVLAESLSDCFALLTANAGQSPRKIFAAQGISLKICNDDINGCVEQLYPTGSKKKKKQV